MRDLLPLASGHGVTVLAGSDLARPAGGIAVEAIRLVDYGLAPDQALEAVTSSVHAAIGKPHSFKAGDPADLIAVDGNPAEDITALERVRYVLRRGTVVVDRR